MKLTTSPPSGTKFKNARRQTPSLPHAFKACRRTTSSELSSTYKTSQNVQHFPVVTTQR